VRNTPHEIEILDPTLIDVIDGVPVTSYRVRETVSGWFTLLDAEELEIWRDQKFTRRCESSRPYGSRATTASAS
jgi:hypothetical protein